MALRQRLEIIMNRNRCLKESQHVHFGLVRFFHSVRTCAISVRIASWSVPLLLARKASISDIGRSLSTIVRSLCSGGRRICV